jgi:hypothetical protein
MTDKLALLWVAVIFGLMGGCAYRCSPSFDYSADVLFDTKSMNSTGKQWGIVSYGTEGYAWEVNRRKSDAQQEMTEICGPMRYQIVEANAIKDSQGVSIAGYSFNISEPSIVMQFECVVSQ